MSNDDSNDKRTDGERTKEKFDKLIKQADEQGTAEFKGETTVRSDGPMTWRSMREQIASALDAAEQAATGEPRGFLLSVTSVSSSTGMIQQLSGGTFQNPHDAVESGANIIKTVIPGLLAQTFRAYGLSPMRAMAALSAKISDAIRERLERRSKADGIPEFRPLLDDAMPCPIHGPGGCPEPGLPSSEDESAPTAKDLENLLLFPKKPLPEC